MTNRRLRFLINCFLGVFTLVGGFAPLVFSEYFGEYFATQYVDARRLDVVVGETKVIPVNNPQKVAVGDPDVADIADASATEIILSAKKSGETNLQIWDDQGQREIAIRVFEQDLNKLKTRLESLFYTAGLREVHFEVGAEEGKVFVIGELPLRRKELSEQLLSNFTEKVINLLTFTEDNPVVEIDVQILEIAKLAVDRLGLDWSTSITFTETQPDLTQDHTLSRQFGNLIKAVAQSQFTRTGLTATLNILQQDNMAKVLARPKLVALSGKEASFLVGGEVPVLSDVSVSSGTTTTSVEYVEYGIKLSILPEVKESGDIVCKLETEIKTIDTSTALAIQTGAVVTTTTPGFKIRNASTELYLKSNQTVFLAGLINNAEVNNLNQVPALGNLPILGALFRSKAFQTGDTELVISITPRVVNYGDLKKNATPPLAKRMSYDEESSDVYSRSVQEMILKNVTYPLEAQRSKLSGTVILNLHLLSNGQLVGVSVGQSSGHTLLDNAAIYSVKRLGPYPSFPRDLTLKEIWVEVPINYQLN